jgi:predicted lipoprotein with Yx(FWY)xxD motif
MGHSAPHEPKAGIVMNRITIVIASAALSVLALAGCSAPNGSGAGGTVPSSVPPVTSAGTELSVAASGLGDIIVDGQGMTAYVFDKDVPGSGTSACVGDCLTSWPPVVTNSESPTVDGVTGEIGTIPWLDGSFQVTVNGWPLYTFAGDASTGETNGQGKNSVWWAVSPSGERITTPAAPSGY